MLNSEDAGRLRPRLLDVLHYGEQHRNKPRDHEALLSAWISRKEEDHLAREIRKKGEEAPSATLVELFELKKKSMQKHKVQ